MPLSGGRQIQFSSPLIILLDALSGDIHVGQAELGRHIATLRRQLIPLGGDRKIPRNACRIHVHGAVIELPHGVAFLR